MKSNFSLLLRGLMGGLFLLPTLAWAGGIVQEAYIDPSKPSEVVGHGVKPLKGSDSVPETHTTKAAPHTIRQILKEIVVVYNPTKQTTTVTWSSQPLQGQQAHKFQIYRRKHGSDKWELVATVDGRTFKFESELHNTNEYDYKVVAIYSGSANSSLNPPTLAPTDSQSEPQIGMGCQLNPSSNPASWWWMLFLLPIALRRRSHP